MIRNYLLVALRNILRQQGFSFINIFGLAIGLACTLLILLWIQDELSFDKFHDNAMTLYRVEQDQYYSGDTYHVNVTPFVSGPVWKEEIPEIKDATRYSSPGGLLFKYEEKSFYENNIVAVDSTFLKMFSYPLKQGSAEKVLSDPYSVVISEDIALKYFGEEDPLGKSFHVDNQYDFTVTGVLKKIPRNSILQFDMLIPFEFMKTRDFYNESWGSNNIPTYVQLYETSSPDSVGVKLTQVVRKYHSDSEADFMINPFTSIHLHAYFGYGHSPGAIQFVFIFSAIAIFVLLIASINFMNLSTAKSATRAKEIGIRKVIGGNRRSILWQFLFESFILTVFALVIAFFIVYLFTDVFNMIAGKDISAGNLFKPEFLVGAIVITLITTFLAGGYPAFFLSAFQPIMVLKGALSSGTKRGFLRRTLVILQFTLSIILIAGTIIIYNQLNYMRNKKLGYNKDHLLYIPMRGQIKDSYEAIKTEFLKDPRILNVTASSHIPAFIGSNAGGADWEGKDPEMETLIGMSGVDYDYIETVGIELKEGRAFSREFPSDLGTDTTGNFLINEEVAKIMNVESPVGTRFSFLGVTGEVVGVMKNFHFRPVGEKIEPLAILMTPMKYLQFILVRVQSDQVVPAMEYLESTWTSVMPGTPFDYKFLDEDLDNMYRSETRMGTLVKYFSIIAIFIACMGLFGLTSFTTEQRTKEIGIRKTMGASVPRVVLLLSTEFMILVIISILIATPIAWYFMYIWLQEYAYHTPLSWWIFGLTALIVLVVAMLTVSYQTIKSGLMNPVDALRYE